MWFKFLNDILEGIISVKLKVADILLEFAFRLRHFSKTFTLNQLPTMWSTYFSGQLIWKTVDSFSAFRVEVSFLRSCSIMNEFLKNLKRRMKNPLVEEEKLRIKHLLKRNDNNFKIQKWFLSLSSESLKSIYQRSLVLGWSQNQSSEVAL